MNNDLIVAIIISNLINTKLTIYMGKKLSQLSDVALGIYTSLSQALRYIKLICS